VFRHALARILRFRSLMHRLSALPLLTLVALLTGAGCRSPQPAGAAAAPANEHPLSFLATQRVVVTPTHALSLAPDLGWSSAVGRSRDVLRTMDADIAAALEERGIRQRWVLPEQLAASYARNRAYGADPYALAEDPLRSPNLLAGTRLPEPLASQLRTMIALHEDARLVLSPVELRVERSGSGSTGRASLRVVLVDPRTSETRWIGQVQSDTASTWSPALTATLAQRLANLVAAP
jgi:hypothetical protein